MAVLFAPLPALLAVRAAPEQIERERSLLDRWSRIYSRFNEVLSGILIVRSFTMEEVEKRRFLKDVDEANRLVVTGVAIDTGYGAASNLVIAVARLSAIGLGAYLSVKGQVVAPTNGAPTTHSLIYYRQSPPACVLRLDSSRVTLGTLIAFLGYIGGLFGPVQGLSGIYQTLSKASVSLEEIFRILNIQEYLGDTPAAHDLPEVHGNVTF